MAIDQSPSTPEFAHCGAFLREAVLRRKVYAVTGEDGLARVPSRRIKGREVTLVWTSRAEAERWSAALAVSPQIREMVLTDFLNGVLPKLAELNRFVGLNWSSGPAEAEIDPAELAERLRMETLARFVEKIAVSRQPVWTIEGAEGPALMVSRVKPNVFVVPVWSERDHAEMRLEGPWCDMVVGQVPAYVFMAARLPKFSKFGFLVSPENVLGDKFLELDPLDLQERLADHWGLDVPEPGSKSGS